MQGVGLQRLQQLQGRPSPGTQRGGALSTRAAVFDQLSISLENAWKKLANEGTNPLLSIMTMFLWLVCFNCGFCPVTMLACR